MIHSKKSHVFLFLSSLAPLALVIALVLLCFRYPLNRKANVSLPSDFRVYLQAIERVNQGSNPYVASDSSPYKYSPGLLVVMKALPASPFHAWIIFSGLSLLGLAWVIWNGLHTSSVRAPALLLIGLILSWKGILETLDYGQMELFILTLAVIAAQLRSQSPFASGILGGVLPWIKLPWGALFLPLLLTPNRDRKSLFYFASGIACSGGLWGILLPMSTFGIAKSIDYTSSWFHLLSVQPHHLFISGMNQSLWISAFRWTNSASLALLLAIFSALALLFLLLRQILRQKFPPLNALTWISPWIIFVQLINPLSWRWGSALLIGIPLAIEKLSAASGGLKKGSAFLWIVVAVLYLVQLNPVVKMLGFHHWSELHEFGSITAFWIVLLILTIDFTSKPRAIPGRSLGQSLPLK